MKKIDVIERLYKVVRPMTFWRGVGSIFTVAGNYHVRDRSMTREDLLDVLFAGKKKELQVGHESLSDSWRKVVIY